MRPLSTSLYLTRNKRRAAPVVIILALAVFAISLTAVLTNTLISSARERNLAPLKKFSMVIGKNSRPLESETLTKLESHPAVAASLPFIQLSTRVDGLFGSEGAPLFAVPKNRRNFFLRHTGLKLAGGRLPDPAKNEVALHLWFMLLKKVKLGDFIGDEVDEKDWLDGKFKVVGELYGPVSISLMPYEYLTADSEMNRLSAKNGRLVFAKRGKRAAAEKYLRSLEDKNVETRTFAYWNEEFKREFASMDTIIWIINGILIVVLSLALGLLNMIYFMQRMNEFGLLAAVGFSNGRLIKRTLTEVLVLTAVGWSAGLLFAHGTYTFLNRTIFLPKGIRLDLINFRAISFTLPIPVMVALFSVLTVVWRLSRLDPVAVIERRD